MQLNELVISSSRTLKRRLHGRTTAKVKSFVIALQKLLCIDCYIVKLRELPVQMKMGKCNISSHLVRCLRDRHREVARATLYYPQALKFEIRTRTQINPAWWYVTQMFTRVGRKKRKDLFE